MCARGVQCRRSFGREAVGTPSRPATSGVVVEFFPLTVDHAGGLEAMKGPVEGAGRSQGAPVAAVREDLRDREPVHAVVSGGKAGTQDLDLEGKQYSGSTTRHGKL